MYFKIINIHNIKSNLITILLKNNFLSYFNNYFIFFILFILASISFFYKARYDKYNILNIFFYKYIFYKHFLY